MEKTRRDFPLRPRSFSERSGQPSWRKPAATTSRCAGRSERLIAAHEKEGSFIDSPALPRRRGSLMIDRLDSVGRRSGLTRSSASSAGAGWEKCFLAEDIRLERKVALKLLPPPSSRIKIACGALSVRRRAASALNHPNILTIHEIGRRMARITSSRSLSRARRCGEHMRRGR